MSKCSSPQVPRCPSGKIVKSPRGQMSKKKILLKKSNLGLDIGSSDTLSEFSDKTKPRNFIYSMGIDVLKNSFSLKNQFFKERRNYILKILNNNNFTKKIFYDLANGRF